MIAHLLLILFALVCSAAFCLAEHVASLAWMHGYTSAEGVGCCSEKDCIPAAVRVLHIEEESIIVEVNGVSFALRATSVHHSEDGHAYWCYKSSQELPSVSNTRCVFWTEGA